MGTGGGVSSSLQFVVGENKAQSSQGWREGPEEGERGTLGLGGSEHQRCFLPCVRLRGQARLSVCNKPGSFLGRMECPFWTLFFFLCCFLIVFKPLLIETNPELSGKDLNHSYDPVLPPATSGALRDPQTKKQNTDLHQGG